ncbi:MAG: hypothetical protein M1833_000522 [Piccolia ochrophora]|nr:MAG: hypothetical protein M1833_000522 [Piccolia ochrophora]
MATIKPIEGRSVHQIQSGQVIVDLCSVVKELVENSLDAGASSIEVRFKNHGLESIEVLDNGSGIAPANYDTIALKHYTSKLTKYDDLTSLRTFGFRGEALSSLCALSSFHIVTATADQVPKGNILEFETSGKLKATQVVASQKGTTISVDGLFRNLPVRRRDLEKNIKREYGKVLAILNAYACISTNVKFVVSNQAPQGKKAVVFATMSNPTTRENIVNVFGAKTLAALVPLDLKLELQTSTKPNLRRSVEEDEDLQEVHVTGHISRPAYGEGRQAPDRQMFFVNGRPCGLPQVSKAINEAYKSYNVHQSPFICADFKMDTNAYDVNVSPDKRSILLHDQDVLLEKLKELLTEMFEKHDHSMPQSQTVTPKIPALRQLSLRRESTLGSSSPIAPRAPTAESPKGDDDSASSEEEDDSDDKRTENDSRGGADGLIHGFFENRFKIRDDSARTVSLSTRASKDKRLADTFDGDHAPSETEAEGASPGQSDTDGEDPIPNDKSATLVRDFNRRVAEADRRTSSHDEEVQQRTFSAPDPIPSLITTPHRAKPGVVQSAFDRMRPKRTAPETAVITIGSKTITSPVGTPYKRQRTDHVLHDNFSHIRMTNKKSSKGGGFKTGLQGFAAPGTQVEDEDLEDEIEDGTENDETADTQPESNVKISRREQIKESGVLQRSLRRNSHLSKSTSESSMNEPDEADKNGSATGEHTSDGEYVDETEHQAREDAKVQQLIQEAEEDALIPLEETEKRADKLLKSDGYKKDSMYQLTRSLDVSVKKIEQQLNGLISAMKTLQDPTLSATETDDISHTTSAEDKLSLTVSKDDFSHMRIIGQFNLGFILASRSPNHHTSPTSPSDLFIIDQHASDEKYNFERLQRTTTLVPQPLVTPLPLALPAVDEETILAHPAAFEKNGFLLATDTSGAAPSGRRCTLLSLPMSAEVTFSPQDLEELIALLVDAPADAVPRPSKVRRLFAMRACRSSIMIGRTLTGRQMEGVVRRMGTIDMPWNCPHGRPTMRHLVGLGGWRGWQEGQGVVGLESDGGDEEGEGEGEVDWEAYARAPVAKRGMEGAEEEDEDDRDDGDAEDGDDEHGEEEEEEEQSRLIQKKLP